MTRPLLDKTIVELGAMADRNRANRAELDLIGAELRHRSTSKAQVLAKKVADHIGALDAGRPETATRAAGIVDRLQAIDRLATKDWNKTAALGRYLQRVHAFSGDEAESLREKIAQRLRVLGASPAEGAGGPTQPSRPSPKPGVREQAGASQLQKAKPMTEARRWTEDAVAALRTRLIDLGKKNPLISFKHGGRAASILRIVDERPDLLCAAIAKGAVGFEPLPGEDDMPGDELTPAFRIAYERARLTSETFLAATDRLGDDERDAKGWQQAERALRCEVRRQLGLPALDYGKTLDVAAIARAHGFDPSFDLKTSDDDDVAAHHEDDKLRVLLTAKELERRLKTISDRYRSHQRESGIDTLRLAIGFVEWREGAAPETALYAPLLLLPVTMDSSIVRGRYEYRLKAGDDVMDVNVALIEKARRHWGLDVPTLRPDESAESYFIRAESVLAKGQGLRLRRYVTLAVLPPMILWKDLDPAAWPDAAFAEHRLLPGLLGAVQVAGEASLGETIDVDVPEWVRRAPALIRPADASQHSALIDVGEGHDLAIEGPPGTGKSETITNMIATALAAGKKVLFVAEKQAALRVVADRLRASGFGSLLLELHGDNAHRADVYDGLRERMKTRVALDPDALASQRLQLDQQRSLLRRYLSLIDRPLGALGRTAYWLKWREIRLREAFDRAVVEAATARWAPADAAEVDRATMTDRRDRLDTFGAALAAINNQAGERTRWVEARHLDPFDQRRQLQAVVEAAQAAAAMAQAGADLQAGVGLAMPEPAGAIDAEVARGICTAGISGLPI